MLEREMSFKDAYLNFWRKAFVMKGRARRKEYWVPMLVHIALSIVLSLLAGFIDSSMGRNTEDLGSVSQVVQGLTGLILLVPNFTVGARRLQDININGWVNLVPLIVSLVGLGAIIFSIFKEAANPAGVVTTSLLVLAVLLVMSLVFIIMFALDGTRGANKYGEDPKNRVKY
ncbi:DUF805 domain-containing protein [Macrococcus equipercicus]|uniref:DUF805 domain-containing protein n=1 Tax=Macrococcus equipercicus TaxID=69967 RepID=A0ABQ6RAR9_9STAP|nr:DUF805 domain-containing protein [Macrococcus equipercicus]KAA1042335.1 DUF805 domain-containing protein [Macrococcus equipercicus]